MIWTLLRLSCVVSVVCCPPATTLARAAEPTQVSVAAAISLKDALDEIAKAYESAHPGVHVALTYGASGQLLAQINAGAPVDVFISASPQQVDELGRAKMTVPGSRRVIVRNQLVLIVPRDAKEVPAKLSDLADAARFRRVAIGEPGTVPAGQYATQAIRAAGIEQQLKPRLIMGLNVRQVLEYVARGEADAGLVYETDAVSAGDAVRVGATVGGHDPVEYPAALIANGANGTGATNFLDYLSSPDAAAVFERRRFEMPSPTTAPARRP